jgi:predicted esterase
VPLRIPKLFLWMSRPITIKMTASTKVNNASPPQKSKPAILCLHGGGNNQTIFEMQTIRIQRLLAEEFEFVFTSAPFESDPGPGMIPWFEDCGPYFRWTRHEEPTEIPEETRTLLSRLAKEQIVKDGRGFVGVLGFSQGAQLASGLLLEEQLGKGIDWGEGLTFGVVCNGVCPPITSWLSQEEKDTEITIPTLHLIGESDPWKDESRRLRSAHCRIEQAALIECDVGHRLPVSPEDNAQVAAEIRNMCRRALGMGKAALVPGS